jgi:hypothetical protein
MEGLFERCIRLLQGVLIDASFTAVSKLLPCTIAAVYTMLFVSMHSSWQAVLPLLHRSATIQALHSCTADSTVHARTPDALGCLCCTPYGMSATQYSISAFVVVARQLCSMCHPEHGTASCNRLSYLS